jgi:hypothetical protein
MLRHWSKVEQRLSQIFSSWIPIESLLRFHTSFFFLFGFGCILTQPRQSRDVTSTSQPAGISLPVPQTWDNQGFAKVILFGGFEKQMIDNCNFFFQGFNIAPMLNDDKVEWESTC